MTDALRVLLARGATIDARFPSGYTALEVAEAVGWKDNAVLLRQAAEKR